MDTFIDKLAQKRNAQEMIRANMTAETAKMEQMQAQMQAYDDLMQEIRQVNLKTVENVAEVQTLLKECVEKLEAIQTEGGRSEESLETLVGVSDLLKKKFQESEDFVHKENVKVYRNVQAALMEELKRQTEELQNGRPANKGSKALLPISILILLGVIADIVLNVLSMMNFKFF